METQTLVHFGTYKQTGLRIKAEVYYCYYVPSRFFPSLFTKNSIQLLCISNSFWVLRSPKSWSKHFFQQFFNLFCSFQSFFSEFTAEINKKSLKMN